MTNAMVNLNDEFRDECAVFGIWNHKEASRMAYLSLYAMQHRGQESAGIVTLHEHEHLIHKGLGLVGDVFSDEELNRLKGRAAIGHARYSTTGQNLLVNAQPLNAELLRGPVAVAHNGNIVNHKSLKAQLRAQGAIFQGTNDTEIILHLLSKNQDSPIIETLKQALPTVEGAFSFVLLTQKKLIALRDHWGFRPLSIGRLGDSWVVASETCAFDLIGAEYVRDVEPGEIVSFDDEGMSSTFYNKKETKAQCIFEHVYFARPDSKVFGLSVYESRKNLGKLLAKESPVAADLVIPVPDSGVPAAIGYSQESGIAFELGIIRNHYVGRTFIQPSQGIRDFGVKIKLNPQSEILRGKRVIVIDDSLVRGTTSKKIINLIRGAGAKEVHFRIASPPTVSPCYYGVDTPQKDQLIAAQRSLKEIQDFVGSDSLAYLSMNGLYQSVHSDSTQFCAACFGEKYPTAIE
ncbi:MAG: amidophosphoribosyltransferase [Bdellovibrionaceae bacterium]|nr:amidophosphoribosyltransferase [Pseudobdellovibrionaceae bacterium]